MLFYNQITLTPEELKSRGILDAPQALRNLELIRSRLGTEAFSSLLPPLLAAVSRAGDPDMALNNAERFVNALEDVPPFLSLCRDRPEGLLSLTTMFGGSRFLSTYLASIADESLTLLADPAYLSRAAGKKLLSEQLSSLMEGVQSDQDLFSTLRKFRRRQMLRIGLRDLMGKADLQETVGELSDLAEVCLQAAYEHVNADLQKKFGRPLAPAPDGTAGPAGFAVIAMGKLGGRELNFSSDIDLMYVYTADGETEGAQTPEGAAMNRITNHQYFVKFAEKLTAAIGQSTEDGFVFRVDLRLRPEGQRGPLAQSLGGYEIYYESWGQTWERSALLKARPVAGDEAAGREFMDRIAPFVYRKYLDFSAIAEVREMKQKINKDVQQKGKTFRDVKLGHGGIREIEFLIQALQLIYSGRDRALREKNSLKALHMLSQKGLLTYQEMAELSRAYVFLRIVEHRIQILDDLQTQTLPAGEHELRSLARRTGYLDPGKEAEALLRDYTGHTRKVRGIYDNLFSSTVEPEPEQALREYALLLDPETGEEEAVMVLAQYGFRDPSKAYRNLLFLREGPAFVHQTPRSRKLFTELFPVLFKEVLYSPDPDMALNHLESFLAAQGSWDAFQSLVRQDLLAVKSLIAIFSNSQYFSRMLVQGPGLLQDLLEANRESGLGTAAVLGKKLAAALAEAEGITDRLDALRRFKHREEMRIGMADLLSAVPLPAVWHSLSRLAEACLKGALELAAAETARRFGIAASTSGLAVIGAGKLGGRELTYGSDLDILFVFSEEHSGAPPAGTTVFEYFSKVAEKTISYLTTMTREGFAYRVDTRLRPTGSKGPLVQSITAFRNYFSAQAETWERQSLVNSRIVAGDRAVGEAFTSTIEELVFRRDDKAALASDIRAMRRRMEEELGKEDAAHYNVKQGAGGLVDIEFLAQFLQLVHGTEQRRLRAPGTYNALRALRKKKLLDDGDYRALMDAYLFMRLLESRMRIVTNQATNQLMRDPLKLHPLARRMGYQDDAPVAGRKLLADYERMREEVRGVFERVVRG